MRLGFSTKNQQLTGNSESHFTRVVQFNVNIVFCVHVVENSLSTVLNPAISHIISQCLTYAEQFAH
jgi:hypothetical protein